jgi:hypothetical protein
MTADLDHIYFSSAGAVCSRWLLLLLLLGCVGAAAAAALASVFMLLRLWASACL